MNLSVHQLIHDLNHPDYSIRVNAAALLGWQGDEAVEAVPALIEMLCEDDPRNRRLAALTLGNIGPAASEAVPYLINVMTEDGDERVRIMAAEALEFIDMPREEYRLAA